MRMYAIKDRLNGFTVPIPMDSDEIAIRWFTTMEEANTDMKFNKNDFSLYLMGFFNKDTGNFESDVKEILNHDEN